MDYLKRYFINLSLAINKLEITKLKPAYLKGFAWAMFSGTATVSAFLLPAYIIASLQQRELNPAIPEWLQYAIIIVLLFCALYHSIYRIAASDHDLKLFSTFRNHIGIFILLAIITHIFF